MALDTIGREFSEQCGMPEHIESSQYVEGDSADLMSDIEGLHHCWECRSSMSRVEWPGLNPH